MKEKFSKIAAFFMNYVVRSKSRFELQVLVVYIDGEHHLFKEAQEEGWEICGDIVIKVSWMHIPMKRRL